MDWSFWEKDIGWDKVDIAIIGAGLVGLNAALEIKTKRPEAHVVVLDRGAHPSGASTRNAGFACFGSVSELLEDASAIGTDGMAKLVRQRWHGLRQLRELHGDDTLEYRSCGGYELFRVEEAELFSQAKRGIPMVNEALKPIFGMDVFSIDEVAAERFGFRGVIGAIHNPIEGSLHPGRMMQSLLGKVQEAGVELRFGAAVAEIQKSAESWSMRMESGQRLHARQILLATNGWASRFRPWPVRTVRNQVLVSAPLDQPFPEHVFHMDRGYYYLRSIDHGRRVLIGGGRHRFGQAEETGTLATTADVRDHLTRILHDHFAKDIDIEHHWSGILGVGDDRSPIIEQSEPGLFVAARLGGMGVAIGTAVGRRVAGLLLSS
jgi:hypothetical protein